MTYPLPITITAGGTTGHASHSEQINKRYNFEGPKVKADFLAVGNSHHNNGGGADDTTNIQNAINAAHSNGVGQVLIEPGTYRITSPLKMHTAAGTAGPIRLIGLGRRQADGQFGPSLVWDGPTDGTPRAMLDYDTTGSNVAASPVEHVRLFGQWIQNASAIRYRKKADIGTYLYGVWFARWHGDAIIYDTGTTNAYLYQCRWDSCIGYGIRLSFASGVIFGVADSTWVCDDLGGSPARGFFLADRGTGDVNLCGFFHFQNINTEVQADLAEEEAGGTDPADRRGIFHLPTLSTQASAQQYVLFNNIKMDTATNRASYSLFLARGGGTANQRGRRLIITGRHIRGTFGDGTASTGHRIPLGNVASAMKAANNNTNFAQFEHKPQNTELGANHRAVSHVYVGTD